MKIAIIGAGAMGSLFGGLLAESGMIVWLLDVWAEHIHAIEKDGLYIERDGHTRRLRVNATCHSELIGKADLAVIFVKSAQTADAALSARQLAGNTGLVLTLQNGLGNADTLSGIVDPRRVVAGTTAHGATLLGPGHIRHAGIGPTVVGMWAGDHDDGIEKVAAVFNRAGIATELTDSIRTNVWEKLLINVGINALTALTGTTNGQLLDLPCTRELMRAAVEEAAGVARALDIAVREDAVAHVLRVARATAGNRSSMGQDVDNRRPTEIAAINGAVVRAAETLGMAAPVNRALTALVETLEKHYR